MKIKDIVEIIQTYNLYQKEMLSGSPKLPITEEDFDLMKTCHCMRMPTDDEIAKYRAEQFELYEKWLESEVE